MDNQNSDEIEIFDNIIDSFESEFQGQTAKLNESFELLLKLLNNIGTNPFEMKFRKIKSSNPAIKEKIFRFSRAPQLLEHIGFIIRPENGEEFYVLDDKNLMILLPFIQHLRNRIELFEAKQVSQDEYYRVLTIQKNKVNIVKKVDEDKKKGEELKQIMKHDREDFRFIEKLDAQAIKQEKQRMESNLQQVSGEEQFIERVIKSDKPVIVYFYADWCPPCKQINEIFESEIKKSNGWVLAKVNCDDHNNAGIKQYNGLEGIPTINFYHKGQVMNQYNIKGLNYQGLKNTIQKATELSAK